MNYFNLNINSTGIYTAEWTNNLPENSTEIGKIKWKKYDRIITICCNITIYNSNNCDTPFTPSNISYKFSDTDLSILRSHLQKCVRREEHLLGFQTAISMITTNNNLFEMLRRLTIIIIEDSVLFIDYSILVWFLCITSKGYKINANLMKILLDIVYKVMISNHKDINYKIVRYNTKKNSNLCQNIMASTINQKYKNLLYSVQLRNSFKGMSCDQDMLDKTTFIWLKRMEANSQLCKFLDIYYDNPPIISYTSLDPKNIIIEALDFHCTNVCEKLYNKANIGISIDKLKQLIWDYSSSTNTRIDINGLLENKSDDKSDNNDLWLIIEPIYKLCCKEIKSEKYL